MSETKQNLEESLFEVAVQKADVADRVAFLDGACRDNPSLRARLDVLLEGHFAGAGFLSPPKAPTVAAPPSKASSTHQMIGRYKLLEKVGEGGFGEVWMAEQREPVKRRVALKIIKLGMDSRQVVARFEAERQALALMDHPNIAKIFDAGTTDSSESEISNLKSQIHGGRPYFVMELVRGTKITEYCDQDQLPTDERLKLFIFVCQAIQHAHQKGIIHRDIKPSNILVTLHDGVPVPKVIDFGIAKATQQELTDKTVFTQFQQFLGTPAYISPEQAEMSGLDIDTRADIYSLGVLLYELLVGQTPFDARQMIKGGLDSLRQIIREREPTKPSTKLKNLTAAEQTTAAQRRKTDVVKLTHLLRGDLDWIVMKCLEKDRTRRYETASGLAADLKRHLNNEPVTARPPSTAYQIRKTWQRNKLAFTAAGAVAFALLAGAVVSTWQAVEATRAKKAKALEAQAAQSERNKADEQRRRAEDSEKSARQLLYAANMNLARQAWEQTSVGRVRQLLQETASYPVRGFEWYYWLRQSRLEIRTFRGHSAPIFCAAFSPHGQWIVTGSEDRTAKVWSAASGKELFSLQGHTGRVASIAFSPDGRQIATGGSDRSVRVWDAANGKEIFRLIGHTNTVRAVTFSPDGRRIVSVGSDSFAKIWDAANGAELLTLISPGKELHCVAFSADGRRIVTGNDQGTVELWELSTRQILRTLTGHTKYVFAIAFSPDGRSLLTGSADRTFRVWDIATSEVRVDVRGHTDRIMSVAFSPDGKNILTGSDDQSARVWDAHGKGLFTLAGHSGVIRAATFSGDGQRILTASDDQTAKLWDAVNGEGRLTIKAGDRITSVDFSPDGQRIVTGSEDRSAKVWSASSGRELLNLKGHTDRVFAVAFSPDGRLIATGGDDQTARVWDAASGQELRTLGGQSNRIRTLAFSPDSQRIVTAGRGWTAKVWDASTGKEILTLKGHSGAIRAVAFSPDGGCILTGSADRTARIWDATTGEEQLKLRTTEGIMSAAFSPDGRGVVTGAGRRATVWDLGARKPLLTLSGHEQQIFSVAYSADGQRILTGSDDQTFRVWEASTGHEVLSLMGHTDAVRSLAISADGRTIVTGSDDTTVRIWKAATEEQLADWQREQKAVLDAEPSSH